LATDWYTCHNIGDLVRTKHGGLGVVAEEPYQVQGFLFIRILVFKKGIVCTFVPEDVEIISICSS